jgi:hypothetical protein
MIYLKPAKRLYEGKQPRKYIGFLVLKRHN